MKLIDKDALVAEIEKLIDEIYAGQPFDSLSRGQQTALWYIKSIMSSINTLEVKEVGISIPNIDDTLKEEGLDPDSKEAKIFKESYYLALEKLKAQKGEEV